MGVNGSLHYRVVTKIVTAAKGDYNAPTEKFELSFPLMTASSYTFQPRKESALSDDSSTDVFHRGRIGQLFGRLRILQRFVQGRLNDCHQSNMNSALVDVALALFPESFV